MSASLADAGLLVRSTPACRRSRVIAEHGRQAIVDAAERRRPAGDRALAPLAQEGLGPTRSEIARAAAAPIVFVRRGTRPGALAPSDEFTRFTWSSRYGPPGRSLGGPKARCDSPGGQRPRTTSRSQSSATASARCSSTRRPSTSASSRSRSGSSGRPRIPSAPISSSPGTSARRSCARSPSRTSCRRTGRRSPSSTPGRARIPRRSCARSGASSTRACPRSSPRHGRRSRARLRPPVIGGRGSAGSSASRARRPTSRSTTRTPSCSVAPST